jgi:pyruvate dehydrogenase E2 component (dihydrolipoamide acetyltransferase)
MDVKLPNLGEGADSGTVVKILVKEGDQVEKEQSIIELENEKAVASIPSSGSGTVGKIYVKEGDKLSVGQKILSLGKEEGGEKADKEESKDDAGGEEEESKEESKPAKAKSKAREEEQGPDEDVEGEGEEEGEDEGEGEEGEAPEPAASPSIRKIARDLGIDLRNVKGSERGGRIVMPDLKAYIGRLQKLASKGRKGKRETEPAKPAPVSIDFSQWGPTVRKPMSQLRAVISRRMSENWNTIPHVTQFDEADVTDMQELRKKFAPEYEKKGTRLTLTGLLLKALANTLKQHPLFNASIDEATNEVVFKEYFHIGIAVDTEAGLIVPVIRDVDKKSVLDLSKDLENLAQRARDRKVSADEMKGGTFTISNQGGIGGSFFTPIVNKPEAAILGLGRSIAKPVVKDGQIVQRTLMPIGLSYDHRLIDGGGAARFVVDLVKAFENFPELEAKV